MPNPFSGAPILNAHSIAITDILDMLNDYDMEELEAIEKYCHNYHSAYEMKPKSIVTEITVE